MEELDQHAGTLGCSHSSGEGEMYPSNAYIMPDTLPGAEELGYPDLLQPRHGVTPTSSRSLRVTVEYHEDSRSGI